MSMGHDIGTDGITLTDDERTAVALHFLATLDLEQHLVWEDYPMLTQDEFELLDREVRGIQWTLWQQILEYHPDVSEVLGRIAP